MNKRVLIAITLGQAAFGYSLSTSTSVEFSTEGNAIVIKVMRDGKVAHQENITF